MENSFELRSKFKRRSFFVGHFKYYIRWLDFSPVAILSAEETAALAAIMSKVDGTVISAIDGHVRITFDVKNIWDD